MSYKTKLSTEWSKQKSQRDYSLIKSLYQEKNETKKQINATILENTKKNEEKKKALAPLQAKTKYTKSRKAGKKTLKELKVEWKQKSENQAK